MIPANDSNVEVVSESTVGADMKLVYIQPHAHLRGKDFEIRLVYPTGEKETVFKGKFDFNWQLGYDLAKPIVLPKGTRIVSIAHYDNSANNPYQSGSDQGGPLGPAELGRDAVGLPRLHLRRQHRHRHVAETFRAEPVAAPEDRRSDYCGFGFRSASSSASSGTPGTSIPRRRESARKAIPSDPRTRAGTGSRRAGKFGHLTLRPDHFHHRFARPQPGRRFAGVDTPDPRS